MYPALVMPCTFIFVLSMCCAVLFCADVSLAMTCYADIDDITDDNTEMVILLISCYIIVIMVVLN